MLQIAKRKWIKEVYLRVYNENKRDINLYKNKEVREKEIIMNKII